MSRPARIVAAFVVLIIASPVSAQAERYELGRRLKAFETAWETADPAARKRALDIIPQATTQFLSFRLGDAGRTLDLSGHALKSADPPTRDEQWVASLSATPSARFLETTVPAVVVTVKPLYAVPGGLPPALEARFGFIGKTTTTVKVDKLPLTVTVPLPPAAAADDTLEVTFAAGTATRRADLRLSRAFDLAARLTALKAAADKWPVLDTLEKATVRDRAELLADLIDGTVPETDLPAAKLLAEAEAMLDGKPAFAADRPGTFWLSAPLGGKKTAAVRVFIPKGLDKSKPVPVVVALHGAGGSENLFFEGYGNGHIVKECETRGWVLVATRGGFTTVPPVVPVLDALAARYPLDPKRTFVVGHSMGAAQTIELLQRHPGRFAAAAALGGAGRVRDGKAIGAVPVFVGVGDKDFALPSARSLHKALVAAGAANATLKVYPDLEHLVIVRAALPDVFAGFAAAVGK